MKRIILSILVIALLVGCGGSYAVDSTSKKFKLDDVSLVTLSGPNAQKSEGTSIQLSPGQGDYAKLVQLVQGEKLTQCPTDNFGLCIITYTIITGETVKVYPAMTILTTFVYFPLTPPFPAIWNYLPRV